MSARGGRDRFRGDHPPRFEEKSRTGRGNVPPSRHLWVGNLSHSIVERDLTHHFLRFGEIENVAFQPGRSYAFINFVNDDEAIAAMKALQGFPIAGNPLRIEFTKAEKSSVPSRDEQISVLRGSPFLQRDSRAHQASPDPFYTEKSKTSDRDTEPSEVLWIGFPSLFKVDDMILRKAFSPFGEIEKISVFPGRSYAFVRFRNIKSACRAKETLQGKLFGNPRVHICFAKSEAGSSNSRRISTDVPLSPSPHFKPNDHQGFSENFRQDRSFGSLNGDPGIRSPQFITNLHSGDHSRKDTLRTGRNNAFEERWLNEVGSELGRRSQERFERHISPTRQHGMQFNEFTQKFPKRGPFHKDPWEMPEDARIHETKKLKTESYPLPDQELPEYPFSDLRQQKPAFPRLISDVPQPQTFDKNFEAGPFQYKQIPDCLMNSSIPHGERIDHRKGSFDSFHLGSESLPSNQLERKRFIPEPDQCNVNEWKWEGTIAKGGTPVCRARCFPVGKVLDMILPEFLDCTARTGLDMLAKHYYQAAGAWVIFFVPESDNDMGFYNEFMYYLEEKQRAAVVKLNDTTTLFLVPPSDFSEKILKVPGKLSISGVVLRLEHLGSNYGSLNHPNENKDMLLSFPGDASYPKPSTHSVPFPPMLPFPDSGQSGVNNQSFLGNAAKLAPPSSYSGFISNSYSGNRHEHLLHQKPQSEPMWSSNNLENSISTNRNVTWTPNSATEPIIQEHHSVMPRAMQQTSSSQTHYTGGISGIPESANGKLFRQEPPVGSLHESQYAQLASSLLGEQSESGRTPNAYTGEDFRQTNTSNQPYNAFNTSQSNQMTSELLTSQYTQMPQFQQQQQQTSNAPQASHYDPQAGANQQLQRTGTQETAEEDPQKRLQATLQLAATLLQQIQQAKGT